MKVLTPALAHLLGDYVAQNEWMAVEKTKRSAPAALHAATYAACFLPLTRDPRALAVIGGTHFAIDRWRLAKYLVWARNQVAPESWRYGFGEAKWDGAPVAQPDWLSGWLLFISDNSVHLLINAAALAGAEKRSRPGA